MRNLWHVRLPTGQFILVAVCIMNALYGDESHCFPDNRLSRYMGLRVGREMAHTLLFSYVLLHNYCDRR